MAKYADVSECKSVAGIGMRLHPFHENKYDIHGFSDGSQAVFVPEKSVLDHNGEEFEVQIQLAETEEYEMPSTATVQIYLVRQRTTSNGITQYSKTPLQELDGREFVVKRIDPEQRRRYELLMLCSYCV